MLLTPNSFHVSPVSKKSWIANFPITLKRLCNVHACPQALARVVSDNMGGQSNHAGLARDYRNFARGLKARRRSLVLPIGALRVGLPRHRALLFKALADACELPCRMLRGPFIGAYHALPY